MSDDILKRILEQAGVPGLFEALTETIPPTDLQSLLLEVFRRRAARLPPRAVLEQYRGNRFVGAARLDPRDLLEFDRLAFSMLPAGFEPLELSPVCPLGTVSVLGPVDQNNTLTTIRNTEVVSDSTNVMALECSLRRRKLLKADPRSSGRIRLCASARLLRTQTFDEPAAFPHFRILSLCTAGRDQGDLRFEGEALDEQAGYYLRLLLKSEDLGLDIREPRLVLFVLDKVKRERFESGLRDMLAKQAPDVSLEISPPPEDARGYYLTARFQIFARDPRGQDLFLVDGGFVDWTRKLLGSRKERLLISGLGTERLLVCFKP